MEILLIHLGSVAECFVATSLFRRWKKEIYNKDLKVTVLVKDQDAKAVFKYNPFVKNIYDLKGLPQGFWDHKFDQVINLNLDFQDHDLVKAEQHFGFGFHKKAIPFNDIFEGKTISRKNLFQIYYNLSGYTWKGESYFFKYYPKAKSKINSTGVAVVNKKISNYISDKLKLDLSNTTYLPYRKNLFKMLDELNRHNNIITDDFLTMNLATYLKKHVFFLKTNPYYFKLEFFGKGKLFKVKPSAVL